MSSSPTENVGVDLRTVSCWEYGSIWLPPDDSCDEEDFLGAGVSLVPLGQLRVVSAWFGDANDPEMRKDITKEVSAEHLVAASQRARLEIPAVARRWGDPASFRLKQLEITYEHRWLDPDRREALLALKARADEKAQSNADLEPLLKRLSSAMVGAVSGVEGSSLGSTSPRWRQLGFQSSDPRTDLRTGILALDCLVYMAEKYPLATSEMIREAQSNGIDYPFAVASINVTQHLARYFHLVKDAFGCPMDPASPRAVHRFAGLLHRLGGEAIEPFCELHAAATIADAFVVLHQHPLLRTQEMRSDRLAERFYVTDATDATDATRRPVMTRLHCNWRRRKQEEPQITVMHFSPVLDETLKISRRFCESARMLNSSEFRSLVNETEVAPVLTPPVLTTSLRPDEESKITESVQATVRKVSETASIFGTYLHGVISEERIFAK